MHEAFFELAFIDSIVIPTKLPFAMLQSFLKLPNILTSVCKFLLSAPIRLVILPFSRVGNCCRLEPAHPALKLGILHFASIVGTIWEDEYTIFSVGFSAHETTLKVTSVFEVYFSTSVRQMVYPLPLIINLLVIDEEGR